MYYRIIFKFSKKLVELIFSDKSVDKKMDI